MTQIKKHIATTSVPKKGATKQQGVEVDSTPPRSRDEIFASVIKKVRAMTPEEGFQSLVASGIYTPEGELTPEYGGPPRNQSKIRNDWRSFVRAVKKNFPKATLHPDVPIQPIGPHWLDITLGSKRIPVEWRPCAGKYRKKGRHGFGFFADDSAYGEGQNKVYTSVAAALRHIRSSFNR